MEEPEQWLDPRWHEAKKLYLQFYVLDDASRSDKVACVERAARMGYGPAAWKMIRFTRLDVPLSRRFPFVTQLDPKSSSLWDRNADAKEAIAYYKEDQALCYRLGQLFATRYNLNRCLVFLHVMRVIHYYETARQRSLESVHEWVLVGRKRLRLCRDVARLIGQLVWQGRTTAYTRLLQ